MKRLFIFLFAFLIITNSYSQDKWVWQNPLPQGNSLFDVQFINSTTAYAVGGSGTVIKTTDAGLTWDVTYYSGGADKILKSLFFLNENEGWAGGYDGKLLHTLNAGVSWDSVSGHTYKIVEGISFTDSLSGIIVAAYQNTTCCGDIFQTTDGGTTWVGRPPPSNGDDNLQDVSFANDSSGIAIGLFGNILRTTNAGTTWQKQNSGTAEQFYAIDNKGEDLWMIAGNGGIILRSTDNGSNWTEVLNGVTSSFEGIDIVNQNTAYVCGYEGAIYKTTDGGDTWLPQQSNTMNLLTDISFFDENTGIAVGSYGTILRTIDGGTTWQEISQGTATDLNAIDFATPQDGYVCGDEGILLKTTNAGDMWTPLNNGYVQNLNDISFANPNVGTAVGESGVVLRTIDGGQNWVLQPSGIAGSGNLTSVSFVDTSTGFAAGYNSSSVGTIIKTVNGGDTWTTSPTGVNDLFYAMDFLDQNYGIAVGSMGTIIFTTDSGNSWNDRSLGFGYTFRSAQVVSDSFAVIAGFNFQSFPAHGVVYISRDGGDNWISRSNGLTEAIDAVYFRDENNGIAVGPYGKLFRTTNGGMNWTTELAGTDNSLHDIAANDSEKVYVVGDGGTIISRNQGVIVNIEENNTSEIPTLFNLYQNYPNPFNPSTTISYDLAKRSKVKLQIFNALGEEVATLVNGEQSAGNYQIQWRASQMPTGIYFYRISADDFVATKRMLYIK